MRELVYAFIGSLLPLITYWLAGGNFERGSNLGLTFLFMVLCGFVSAAWGKVQTHRISRNKLKEGYFE